MHQSLPGQQEVFERRGIKCEAQWRGQTSCCVRTAWALFVALSDLKQNKFSIYRPLQPGATPCQVDAHGDLEFEEEEYQEYIKKDLAVKKAVDRLNAQAAVTYADTATYVGVPLNVYLDYIQAGLSPKHVLQMFELFWIIERSPDKLPPLCKPCLVRRLR